MKLFIFDFDGTIVKGHTHNTIVKALNAGKLSDKSATGRWNLVKDFPTVGSSDDWRKIFETLIQQGHSVYIASFNSFGEIIPIFLNKTIGLTKTDIEQIKIIARLPNNPNRVDKNEHIKQAITDAQTLKGFSGKATDVIFMDDSLKNIEAADAEGYQVILAKKDASHLSDIKKVLASEGWNNPESKTEVLDEDEIIRQTIELLRRQKKEALEQVNKIKEKSNTQGPEVDRKKKPLRPSSSFFSQQAKEGRKLILITKSERHQNPLPPPRQK